MKLRSLILIIASIILIAALSAFLRQAYISFRKPVPVKKRAARQVPLKRFELPSVEKRFKNPKVAVVIDDFGYNMNNLKELFDIRRPITLSILPHLAYSMEISGMAAAEGHEIILHLPLEPHRKDVRQEVDTINSNMSEKEVLEKLQSAIKSLDHLKGISNHMGSKSTEEKGLMLVIFKDLKRHGLYFFDSLTSEKSVCRETANQAGVRYARRDIFLDMGRSDPDYIKKQVLRLRMLAFKKGHAIAVCHDRPDTIKVLSEMMPALSADGINFVFLSELEA